MSDYGTPVPAMIPKATVYEIAEQIANSRGYRPGDDLHDIVSSLGGKIKVSDNWDSISAESGSIEIDSIGQFTIFISAFTHPLRDRFTIAHELGHYMLHYVFHQNSGRKLGKIRVPRFGSDRLEWEANWFAAAFLMPKSEFIASLRNNTAGSVTDFVSVAQEFAVSVDAAKTRSKALGWEFAR
jgi:hypothetical protein